MTPRLEPSERTVVANRLRHHVLVWNDEGEETVVLCHGYLDQAWSFSLVADRLVDAGYRVVAFDWRGHGGTDAVGPGGYYHFDDYVLDLHELLPALAPPEAKVHLVGHSMGGTAVALFAATHPGVLASLTLIEGLGPLPYAEEAPDKMMAWLKSVDRARRRGQRPVRDLLEAVKRLRVQNPELPANFAYFLAERSTRPAPEGEGRVWSFDPLHRTTSPKPFDLEVFLQFLRRIEVRTLVVSGTRGYRTHDHATRVAALPRAREVEIADGSHMLHWLAPGALAEHLVGFFAG